MIHDPTGIKLFNRLRVGFGNLREQFCHNVADSLNPLP